MEMEYKCMPAFVDGTIIIEGELNETKAGFVHALHTLAQAENVKQTIKAFNYLINSKDETMVMKLKDPHPTIRMRGITVSHEGESKTYQPQITPELHCFFKKDDSNSGMSFICGISKEGIIYSAPLCNVGVYFEVKVVECCE